VRDACDLLTTIPMAAGVRSLNISVATGIALGEALRQTRRLGEA
jgi:tRNA (cytidine/uridine-2'-O-)-methyltransferase